MSRIGAGSSLGSGASSGGVQIQVDTILASGSYIKPTWAKTGTFFVIGGQGAGGSGRRGATLTARFGGGSGGAPAHVIHTFAASAIDATGTVIIPAAATGGAAVTVDNTDGNAGGNGGSVTVIINAAQTVGLAARGGTGGGGGTAGGGGAGAANAGMYPAVIGAASAIATAPAQVFGAPFAAPGGAGGGIDAADVARNGGLGAVPTAFGFIGAAAGGVVGGAVPANGAVFTLGHTVILSGGGGGAASTTAAAQAGGTFGAGGGASANGFNSGAGSDGFQGRVLILWEG
jgi:hypothetical protein